MATTGRLDHSRVFVTNLMNLDSAFHRVPDWHNGEGCHGPYHRCNVNTRSHRGVQLPDHVTAPCGMDYMAFLVIGSDGDHRPDRRRGENPLVADPGRMHFQHPLGAELPRCQAEKIAHPCKRCFPAGGAS